MIEYLQMVQRTQMETIERDAARRRRFWRVERRRKQVARLKNLISALF